MIDFVKFKLKSEEEIFSILQEIDDILLFVCTQCYTPYTQEKIKQQCRLVFDILKKLNKNIKKCIELNFLCNTYINKEKILETSNELTQNKTICVFSCGLGTQNIAQIINDKEIITISDSIQPRYHKTKEVFYHGIAINNDTFCAGCGECFLNYTGGICPIVECQKSLLNGPCGGAKNNKCEVDKTKECAWIKICNSIKEKKYKITNKVLFRNFNNFSFKEKKQFIEENYFLRIENFYGGLHPNENKDITENIKIKKFLPSEIVKIFLLQHIGKPALPMVKIGDYVFLGQKIATAEGFVSSNIHSSISGKVIDIKEEYHPIIKKYLPAIIIENDYKDIKDISIIPHNNWQNLSKKEILNIIFEKGIVGLGGAMFPTYTKLSLDKRINTLIVNASECEPYVNVDNRIIIEKTKEIMEGLEIIKYLLDIKNVIIAIEDNKLEAIEILKNFVSQNIKIEILKTKYPQGAEKILIKKLLGIRISKDKLPQDFELLVHNVSTIYSIYDAIVKGLPLIERIITVSGELELQKSYGNYIMKIGTPLEFIVKNCYNENINLKEHLIKYSGYFMGTTLDILNTSIVKGCNSILVIPKKINFNIYNECIKCGRCVDVCPMELEPLEFVFSFQKNKTNNLEKLKIKECIECGCCEYICSSKISIVEIIKQLKIKVG